MVGGVGSQWNVIPTYLAAREKVTSTENGKKRVE